MSKRRRAAEVVSVLDSVDSSQDQSGTKNRDWKKKFIYTASGFALIVLIATGIMAKNNWLPSTDSVTGKKTGWFGASLPQNASSSWNPLAPALPTATPQLSKEYIYAGGRMLAVEDANASASPPADLAVWRPGTGYWFVLGGPGSQQTSVPFGTIGDNTVPGDYDGDGKTDFSVFRPTEGKWYIQRSTDTSLLVYYFGVSSDKRAQADYDGDGKTDAALFRPDTPVGYATWYIQRSSDAGLDSPQFGLASDIPAPADYDGDGKADVAVWRPGNLTFYILRSSDGLLDFAVVGSAGSDIPVPADYDGDGRADMAVKSGANWIIKYSSTNTTPVSIPWQLSTDKEVPNDYDGDGKVDIAVWRPAESSAGAGDAGMWYIRQSSKIGQSTELRQVHWGSPGDIPVPAFYRR